MKPKLKTIYTIIDVNSEIHKKLIHNLKESVFAFTDDDRKFIADTIHPDGKLRDDSDYPDYAEKWLKEKQLITFTQEEYNQYIEEIIKQTLKIVAEDAKMTGIAYGNDKSITDYEVDRESIMNTFDKIFKKLKL